MSKKEKNIFSYDAALKEVEEIVNQLQESALSLDEMSEKSRRAAELIKLCRAHLQQIETNLQKELT